MSEKAEAETSGKAGHLDADATFLSTKSSSRPSHPRYSTRLSSGDIAAIYDIIWHASTHPCAPLSVQTMYTGSRIIFRKKAVSNDTELTSVAQTEYQAVLKFEGRESVYGCDTKLFQNFDMLALPRPSTFSLSSLPAEPKPTSPSPTYTPLSPSLLHNSNPFSEPRTGPSPTLHSPSTLHLHFTTAKDDEDYPFLHFQFRTPTEIVDAYGEKLQMCAVGWAKRREFDDEVPTGLDTCLSEGEREKLRERREIDMEGLEREVDGLEEGEVRE